MRVRSREMLEPLARAMVDIVDMYDTDEDGDISWRPTTTTMGWRVASCENDDEERWRWSGRRTMTMMEAEAMIMIMVIMGFLDV